MGELPNSQVPHYDMEMHLWLLKLKQWEGVVEGRFTHFYTYEEAPDTGAERHYYPKHANKDFAFVPREHLQDWNVQSEFEVNPIPSYIIMFNKHDIDSLSILTKDFRPPINFFE